MVAVLEAVVILIAMAPPNESLKLTWPVTHDGEPPAVSIDRSSLHHAGKRRPRSLTPALASIHASVAFTVQIEDEHGHREGDPWSDLRDDALLGGEHPGTCCLRFLDPYGNTVFNQVQIPVLLEELRALAARQRDRELQEAAERLHAFVRTAEGQIHTYVRFVGD